MDARHEAGHDVLILSAYQGVFEVVTAKKRKTYEDLRSRRWIGVDTLRAWGHRSRLKEMGFGAEDYTGKPVIGIINTWSDMNTCHSHFPERVEEIKRGVWQAGGFPVELPAMSLGEQFVKPTTMLYRNFLAMEVEELLRCHPIDGAVLMGGCDKTTPATASWGPCLMKYPLLSILPGRADAARQFPRPDARLSAPISGNTGPSTAPAPWAPGVLE